MFGIKVSFLGVEDPVQSCLSKVCDTVRNEPAPPDSQPNIPTTTC